MPATVTITPNTISTAKRPSIMYIHCICCFCLSSSFFRFSSCLIWYLVFLAGFYALCSSPFSTSLSTSASKLASLFLKLKLSFIESLLYNQILIPNCNPNIQPDHTTSRIYEKTSKSTTRERRHLIRPLAGL